MLTNNLLAFSAGVDSTALFFWLEEKQIPFDMVTVNYHTRQTSDEEAEYAKELARKYGKKIFIKDCRLAKFSEQNARKCRYEFFEEIIRRHGYKTLILAHQLNDRLEWFLMQFTKGAGLKELISINEWEEREHYKIWRPFYNISREKIVAFLNERDIKYYVDESNFDTKYKRNYFRHFFSNRLIKEFEEGIKRSFEYLQTDLELIFQKDWVKKNNLYFFKKQNPATDIKKVDAAAKELGVIMTKAQRDEVIKTGFSCVIQGKIAIDSNKERIYISPYIKTTIPKKIREEMRKRKIPPKIRGYLYKSENEQL
ncbi:tRNA lysidine(34) synthetase TilS [Nautilia sp.]